MNERREEDGFRFFLRHEKEGDGADDDDDDSGEDEHDGGEGEFLRPKDKFQGSRSSRTQTALLIFLFCDLNVGQTRPWAPFGREFRNEALNISYRIAPLVVVVP